MSHLELAEQEEADDTETRCGISSFLAMTGFKLGPKTDDLSLLATGIKGLASIIDEMTAQSCFSLFVMETMEITRHSWNLSTVSRVRADVFSMLVSKVSYLYCVRMSRQNSHPVR